MDKAALKETKAVLAKADTAWRPYSCPASGDCCRFKNTGLQPWLWPSEWAVLMEHLKQSRRPLPEPRGDGSCPFFDGARCTVYAARPFGCRTYYCHRRRGPADEPVLETSALLDRLTALHAAEGSAPKPMMDWYEEERAAARSDAVVAGPGPGDPARAP